MQVVIYHNPKCSKSRRTLELLRSRNIEPQIVEYLKTPPTREQLVGILSMLAITPRELMRTGEAEFTNNALDEPTLSDEQLIEAIIEHPVIMQRPIVVCGGRAAIGRPPENVLDLL